MHAPAAVAKAQAEAAETETEAVRICGFKLKERKESKTKMGVKNKVEHGCRCTV